MDLYEAKYKELREKLFAINLKLEQHKRSGDTKLLAELKRQHTEIKRELARFKTEQKQRGGK